LRIFAVVNLNKFTEVPLVRDTDKKPCSQVYTVEKLTLLYSGLIQQHISTQLCIQIIE